MRMALVRDTRRDERTERQAMTPRQRRYMGALWLSVALAIAAALTAGWVALAFDVGSVAVLVVAGRRRLRQCWRDGI